MELRETEEARRINDRLEEIYGHHTIYNKPNFRIVYSETEYEKRLGEFTDVDNSGNVIRTVKEIRLVPKYPWIDRAWVLERIIPNPHQDLREGDYTYEPIFAFDEGVEVSWWSVNQVVQVCQVRRKSDNPKTQSECDTKEAELLQKEKDRTRNMMDMTVLETCFEDGGAVSFSGMDARPSQLKDKVH